MKAQSSHFNHLTPCTELMHPWLEKYQVRVWIKQDYLNHSVIQGNKLHKLKYNLQAAKQLGTNTLLTFGGAYSNHIAATAVAAKEQGFKAIGVIRGDELAGQPEKWSATLIAAQQHGMQFCFVSRKEYRLKTESKAVRELLQTWPQCFVIPEGGSNAAAVRGFDELCAQINQQVPDWSDVFCPVGTGGTLAGLVANFAALKYPRWLSAGRHLEVPRNHKNRKIHGVAVLKQADYLQPQIQARINEFMQTQSLSSSILDDWQLLTNYAGRGYGRTNPARTQFQQRFQNLFKLPLDAIYTNKMLYAVYQEIKAGKLTAGSKLVIVHTGGLQGNPNFYGSTAD